MVTPSDFENATVFYEGWGGPIVPLMAFGLFLLGGVKGFHEFRRRFGLVVAIGGNAFCAGVVVFCTYSAVRAYVNPRPEIALRADAIWCGGWGDFWVPWSEVSNITHRSTGRGSSTAEFSFTSGQAGLHPWLDWIHHENRTFIADCNITGLNYSGPAVFKLILDTYLAAKH